MCSRTFITTFCRWLARRNRRWLGDSEGDSDLRKVVTQSGKRRAALADGVTATNEIGRSRGKAARM